MSKAFTRETDSDDDEEGGGLPPLPAGGKNYITPQGLWPPAGRAAQLIDEERPKVVDVVHWAASNGDRSENGDYLYGKKRLREIDRRIRFLTKRLEIAEVTDPSLHHGHDQVFFGATVTYAEEDSGVERTGHHPGHRRGRQRPVAGELDLAGRAGAAEGARGATW
jgi:transcription elongation factor GreB